MRAECKSGRIEWERRLLLERFPEHVHSIRTRRITDNYIDGTSLRLRQQSDDGGETVFKLTQKLPTPAHGAQQGFTTTIYLSKSEFSLLALLPAKVLRKTRCSVLPFGIDVFEGTLKGLVLAEAEFNSAADADALTLPPFLLHEVTVDQRFTGGCLVRAEPLDLKSWRLEYGITLERSDLERA